MFRTSGPVLSGVRVIFINFYAGQSSVVRCKDKVFKRLHRTQSGVVRCKKVDIKFEITADDTAQNTGPSGVPAGSYVTLTSCFPKLNFELCNLITYF